MGTATMLRSQGRFRPETTRIPQFRNSNPNLNFSNSRRRKRSPGNSPMESPHNHPRGRSHPQNPNFPAKNLVMGQVTILKRGEPLIPAASKEKPGAKRNLRAEEAELGTTDRLGPDPELVNDQVRVKELRRVVGGTYAGGGFFTSPPPSSVPVPGFLWKLREA